ncbi:MAG: hypothetical protein H7A24_02980 [Leptospiraceae bacterium]|nr:hypothetical protein [Leptospiraceae bacterium]MCP5510812.1 hypothetical protein [Leptospiraceae bacterium]
MVFWKSIPEKIQILLVSLLFLVSVSILDRLIFAKAFYQFPNLMEWDTSPWYNFAHLKNTVPDQGDSKGIFVTGSSVSLYSALPGRMTETLERPVLFYSHVAMSPTDFSFYLDSILEKEPDVILYPLAPSDFQLDFHKIENGESMFQYDKWVEDYSHRNPVMYYYPLDFLKTYRQDLKKDDVFNLLTKSIFYINRMRNFVTDPFFAYYEKVNREGRSYHNYTGTVPREGIWRKGWVAPNFHIDCELKEKGQFDEYVFISQPQSDLTIKEEGRVVFQQVFQKTGWVKIRFQTNSKGPLHPLEFTLDKTVSSRIIDPKSYAKEQFYGLRLSQNFCKKDIDENISYLRREVLEDISLGSMSPEEYREDYFNRLEKDIHARPELFRTLHIRSIKSVIGKEEFKPWIEFENLKKAIEKVKKTKTRFVLINIPENPLEVESYQNEKWFEGYLEYLKGMEDGKNIFFFDRHDFITDYRYFLDVNHLTYKGANLMSDEYSKILRSIIE